VSKENRGVHPAPANGRINELMKKNLGLADNIPVAKRYREHR